jgi:hexulose-6-phosphate isomerase
VFPVLSTTSCPVDVPLIDHLAFAAAHGFSGLELLLDEACDLTSTTSTREFSRIGRAARDRGCPIVSVAAGSWDALHDVVAEPADPDRAVEQIECLLERAQAVGASALVIPPDLSATPGVHRRVSYLEALNRTYDRLTRWRFAAEARGVVLALQLGTGGFPLSPLDARELLDRLNSPCIAASLAPADVCGWSDPHDWLEILGNRLARFELSSRLSHESTDRAGCNSGTVHIAALQRQLNALGYAGPVVLAGNGRPEDVLALRATWRRAAARESGT